MPKILFAVYCICGVAAAIGGLVSASQVAAASSTFGFQKEFPVIAAAVLGGTSLFGGRGGVVGTVFGAVLIQTVENGLVMTNADPYVYPLIISVIIFIAVLVNSVRTRHSRPARAAQDPGGGNMSRRLRGTVIGCGFFAQNHLNAWQDLARRASCLRRCATSTRPRPKPRQSLRRRRLHRRREMLRRERLDLVDIVTRHDTHRPLAERAIAHGIATIVQKPFATEWQDCVAIVEAARAAGVRLDRAREFPLPGRRMRRALAEIRKGPIGAPNSARIRFRTGTMSTRAALFHDRGAVRHRRCRHPHARSRPLLHR